MATQLFLALVLGITVSTVLLVMVMGSVSDRVAVVGCWLLLPAHVAVLRAAVVYGCHANGWDWQGMVAHVFPLPHNPLQPLCHPHCEMMMGKEVGEQRSKRGRGERREERRMEQQQKAIAKPFFFFFFVHDGQEINCVGMGEIQTVQKEATAWSLVVTLRLVRSVALAC